MSANDGRFRIHRVNFAQISNTALQDKNLSLKAKGLYAVIQSLITIPGIDLRLWKLRSMCKEGDKAFDGAWKELKTTGYLKQYRMPSGQKGAFMYEYDLLFEPDLSTPSTINLRRDGKESQPKMPASQPGGKVMPQNIFEDHAPRKRGGATVALKKASSDHTPQKGGDGEKHENDHTPQKGPYAKRTLCLKHPMLNGGGNSNTLYSNTLLSNTKFSNTSVSQSTDKTNTVKTKTDGQTDEIRQALKKQIDLDWIAETHPDDVNAANSLLDCMAEMLSEPSTKIHGVNQSRYALKKRLEHVDEEDVAGFLEHMRERGMKPKEIRNISAYWKSAFISYLGEQELTEAMI